MLENINVNSFSDWFSLEPIVTLLQNENNQAILFGMSIAAIPTIALVASKYGPNPPKSKWVKQLFTGSLFFLFTSSGLAQKNPEENSEFGLHQTRFSDHSNTPLFFYAQPNELYDAIPVPPQVFPLNSETELSVGIPESFKKIPSQADELYSKMQWEVSRNEEAITIINKFSDAFMEFIPHNANLNNWDELITINHISSSLLDAFNAYNKIQLDIEKNLNIDKSIELLYKTEKRINNEVTLKTMGKDRPAVIPTINQLKEGFNEIYLIMSYQVSNKICLVQYRCRYHTSNDVERNEAIEKTQNFINNIEVTQS